MTINVYRYRQVTLQIALIFYKILILSFERISPWRIAFKYKLTVKLSFYSLVDNKTSRKSILNTYCLRYLFIDDRILCLPLLVQNKRISLNSFVQRNSVRDFPDEWNSKFSSGVLFLFFALMLFSWKIKFHRRFVLFNGKRSWWVQTLKED